MAWDQCLAIQPFLHCLPPATDLATQLATELHVASLPAIATKPPPATEIAMLPNVAVAGRTASSTAGGLVAVAGSAAKPVAGSMASSIADGSCGRLRG